MAKAIYHRSVTEFERMNENYLDMNFYSVLPVQEMIQRHFDNVVTINIAFNVVDKFGSFILGLAFRDPNVIMLYGDSMSDECMKALAETLNEGILNAHSISGSRKLILDLYKYHNKNYGVISDRLIYLCREVNDVEYLVTGYLRKAEMTDAEELSNMSYDFSVEEYGDRKEHDLNEQAFTVIYPGIDKGSIYVWVEKGKVRCMAQVSTNDDAPILGHFFTPEKYRGKGYGNALLHNLTKNILSEYHEISLISNVENPISNKIFVNTGYKVISEWIKIYPVDNSETKN